MNKTVTSKIGIGILFPLFVIFSFSFFIAIYTNPNIVGMSILFIVFILVVYIFFITKYEIENTTLHSKCGFLYNTSFDILSGSQISEINNPISSPALLWQRFVIKYNTNASILASQIEYKNVYNPYHNIIPLLCNNYK